MKYPKLLVSSIIGLTLVATGCSSSTKPSSNVDQTATASATGEGKSTEQKKENVTITMSYWGSDFDKIRNEKIKAEFVKVHPEIDVQFIQISNDAYSQKMLATMASGEPYDVIQLAEAFYSFASKGTLEDLTPYIQRDKLDLKQYYQAAVDAYSYKGKVMGIPMRMGSMMLFYNKSLFDQAGVSYPTDNWSYSDLLNAAKKISDPANGVFGLNAPNSWWANYGAFIKPRGGSLLSADRAAFTLDSKESIEGLTFMQNLIWKDHVAPQPKEVPQGVDLWSSGKLGMMIDGPWWVLDSQTKVKDFAWDIALPPKDKVAAVPLFSNAFHITKASKHKDAAWEVLKFWTGKTGQSILATEHGDVPSLKEIANSPAYLDLGGKAPANFKALTSGAEHAYAPEATAKWDEINNAVGVGLDAAFNLNEPLQKVIPEVKGEVEKLLQEGKKLEK